MTQLENIEAIEKRLWASADNLRANSNYASNEYFMPVMGLIFLRHSYSRYLMVKDQIEASMPTRAGKTRPLTKEDFSRKSSIFLKPEAQFDHIVELPDSADRAQAMIKAMESIELDYENLRGVLPKSEYQELDNNVLGQLLRTFNDPALKNASGDIFGRIYEYFLTGFADQKAHDGGEFLTPVSLVQMIVYIIEPNHGKMLDPAIGTAGMFVQSSHFMELSHQNPTEQATFYGLEKNPITIRLAKMNLAVHGLEGNIQKAITYYEDPHEMVGKADFVMANPPFNVDEVDAEKIKNDPRLPFGLPGVNKKGAVSNGNYLWISYFYSYLNEHGRAGFVMSSQASSAGGGEAKVRQKLIETGYVDAMMSIRSNFFYTRTVPCELWFLDRGKPEKMREKVLMIDARNIYRKVTRKIYDFSPEQRKNMTSIVWLYRGQEERFLKLVGEYLDTTITEAKNSAAQVEGFIQKLANLLEKLEPFLKKLPEGAAHAETLKELRDARTTFINDNTEYKKVLDEAATVWKSSSRNNAGLRQSAQRLAPLSEQSRDLVRQLDLLFKLVSRLIEICENELKAKGSEHWMSRETSSGRKVLDDSRKEAVEQLKKVHYFHKQAHWLQERFPEAKLRDVEGLVKLVDRKELEANDWSLTPGRYVGVVPEVEDEDFDFEEALRDIHVELQDLNTEAVGLAGTIARNFEELGI